MARRFAGDGGRAGDRRSGIVYDVPVTPAVSKRAKKMIDSQTLTRSFLEEACFFSERTRYGDDATGMSPEERFEKLVALCPLPDAEQIALVLEEVFWSSLLTEEGRPCRPRLLYIPRQENLRQATHRLAIPVALTRENLRKLSPSQGPLGYLTWDCASNAAEITGVQGRASASSRRVIADERSLLSEGRCVIRFPLCARTQRRETVRAHV
jgi:hypothetical protein